MKERLTEADFTTMVVNLAYLYGWKVCHFRPAKTARGYRTALQGDKGLPDIIAARNGRVVFAELKVGKNKLTPDQEGWIHHLGGDTYIWRPEDWDEIVQVFSGGK